MFNHNLLGLPKDLYALSPNQRNLLIGIACKYVTEPFSQEFTNLLEMNASSVKKSLDFLLKEDWIYKKDNGQYRVLDPAIEFLYLEFCRAS